MKIKGYTIEIKKNPGLHYHYKLFRPGRTEGVRVPIGTGTGWTKEHCKNMAVNQVKEDLAERAIALLGILVPDLTPNKRDNDFMRDARAVLKSWRSE